MYKLKEALKVAKSFTMSRASKYENSPRPALRGAWVTEQYVYATNSEFLIRIEHDADVKEPYVQMYKTSDENNYKFNPVPYPSVERIVPDKLNASWCYEIADLKEWQQIQEMAALVKNKNTFTTLNLNLDRITAKNPDVDLGLEFTYRHLPLIRNIEYRPSGLADEPTLHYNAKHMIAICKAFKQMKYKGHLHLYIFGEEKPMTIEGDGIVTVQLPLREKIQVPETYQPKKKAHA